MRVAAVDCGTNSIRLLVADAGPDGGLVEVDRRMRIVRLGEGVDATGRLGDAALARTLAACDEYARVLDRLAPDAVRFVATSATRDAANRDAFADGVRARLGVEPEVVPGREEGRLSFAGAVSGLGTAAQELPGPFLVVDIGGGSTEFVLGELPGGGGRPVADPVACSVDVGCVRLTERTLRGDPPSAAEVAATTALVREAVDRVAEQVPLHRARTLVGVAGSVTTVAAAVLGLPRYDRDRIHGSRLPARDVAAVTRWLLGMRRVDRAALPWLEPGRVDVIGAGALVLDVVLARVAPTLARPEVVASETDILDGIALGLL